MIKNKIVNYLWVGHIFPKDFALKLRHMFTKLDYSLLGYILLGYSLLGFCLLGNNLLRYKLLMYSLLGYNLLGYWFKSVASIKKDNSLLSTLSTVFSVAPGHLGKIFQTLPISPAWVSPSLKDEQIVECEKIIYQNA